MTASDIRRQRIARGWSQTDLGRLLGFRLGGGPRISRLETGADPISPGMAARLREIFREHLPAKKLAPT